MLFEASDGMACSMQFRSVLNPDSVRGLGRAIAAVIRWELAPALLAQVAELESLLQAYVTSTVHLRPGLQIVPPEKRKAD